MEDNSVSIDQFKVNHLRNRIAQITADYELSLADIAVRLQAAQQQIEQLQNEAKQLAQRVLELEAQQEDSEAEPENEADEEMEPEENEKNLELVKD